MELEAKRAKGFYVSRARRQGRYMKCLDLQNNPDEDNLDEDWAMIKPTRRVHEMSTKHRSTWLEKEEIMLVDTRVGIFKGLTHRSTTMSLGRYYERLDDSNVVHNIKVIAKIKTD